MATLTKVVVDPAPLCEIATIMDETTINTKLFHAHSSPPQVSYPHPAAGSPSRISGRGRGHSISKLTTQSTAKKSRTPPLPAGYASWGASAHLPPFTRPVSAPFVGVDTPPHTSGLLFRSRRNPLLMPPYVASGVASSRCRNE